MTCYFLSDKLDVFGVNKEATKPNHMSVKESGHMFPADGFIYGPGYHPSQAKPLPKSFKKNPE